MTSEFSWQNCQPLPCFILYSKAKLAKYLLTSYFCIPIPCDEKDIFFGQFQKMLQVFIAPVNFSFFSISGWGTDLDYCNAERFALETNQDHSIIFEVAPKYCILDSFVDDEGYSISSIRFLPQQQIQWSSGLNFPIPIYFSSLISLRCRCLLLPSPAPTHILHVQESWQ